MSSSKRKKEAISRKSEREQKSNDELKKLLLENYPSFPKEIIEDYLRKAQWPGAILRWSKNRNIKNLKLSVTAYVRHNLTEYDSIVRKVEKKKARIIVSKEIKEFVEKFSN